MTFRVHVSTIFHCPLERAFKTPMLCDVSKIHTGYGPMPRITHCTDDAHWGQPGHAKKVHAAKSLTQPGGFISTDKVIERVENKYWKIEVSNFQSWMMGFYTFVGEWTTTELEPGRIQVDYAYTLYAGTPLLYPLQWLFARLFWKRYMKRVLENIRQLAYREEPYRHP